MIHLSCESVSKQIDKIDRALSSCKSAFHGNWNDVVHDSFERFFHDVEKNQGEVDSALGALKRQCASASFIKDGGAFNREIAFEKAKIGMIAI